MIQHFLKELRSLYNEDIELIADRLKLILLRHPNHVDEMDLTLKELTEAINKCHFHFHGNLLESFGLNECPCECYCKSCEVIPESAIPKRMQELARDMNEENVMNEFIEQYCTKDENGSIKLTTNR